MAPFFATIDSAIMGRKTLEAGLKMGGTVAYPGIATYVFSRSLRAGERDGITFTRDSPADVVAQIRKKPGKDIWLMGGGELARDFLKADLVDGLFLGIVPVLLAKGLPLFPTGFPQRDFSLIENKAYSQGLIAFKYERVRSTKKRQTHAVTY